MIPTRDVRGGDDENYEAFVAFVDRFGLDDAHQRMSRLLGNDTADRARTRYEADMARVLTLTERTFLVSRGHRRWYAGSQSGDRFWPAFRTRLSDSKHWVESDIELLDGESTLVLDLMESPADGTFPSKGLVLGHVQSGKTSNFTAVSAKAGDRGYRLFIVLSGVHDALRNQTQERLGEDLVELNDEFWNPLTGPTQDFVAPQAATVYLSSFQNQKVLCVVKKNAFRLKALRDWLQSANSDVLASCPTIIIDDEADQASVATAKMNPLIRSILDVLPKAVYVGYSATPFANLLIDPSAGDLYPAQFIYALRKPDNHFGTQSIFGRDATEFDPGDGPLDGFDMVREVPADELPVLRPERGEPAAQFRASVSASLRTAISYFLLATAARRLRGTGTRHSTMLVHTSVNTTVHQAVADAVRLEVARVEEGVQTAEHDVIVDLERIWNSEVDRVPAAVFGRERQDFREVLPGLAEVAQRCRVIMDNYRSSERLAYSEDPEVEPTTAIVVGGNTLSRGLTLHGLVVSLFVRGASAYDTLLQMGRWFGYREGYEDLPRIWMTAELRRWFRHLALVEYEVRNDIDRYIKEGLEPTDVAVRIRKHPGLAITSAAKMRDAVPAEASYGGRRVQPRYFKRTDSEWLAGNAAAAETLILGALADGVVSRPREDRPEIHLLEKVDADRVLAFLQGYQFHESEWDKDRDLISRYIRSQVQQGALRTWTVALMGGPADDVTDSVNLGGGFELRGNRRSRLDEGSAEPNPETADIKTLMSKEHYVADLDIDLADARRMTEEGLRQAKTGLKAGLLLIYPIDRVSPPDLVHRESRRPLDAAQHVVAAALVFPGTGQEAGVNYVSADLGRLGMTQADVESDDVDLVEGVPDASALNV